MMLLVMAGTIYYSTEPQYQCFVLQREDKCLFALQAFEHGPHDSSPFDPFSKRKCEIYGRAEGSKFIVRKIKDVHDPELIWEGPTIKQCPSCLITVHAGCDMCPYCTSKC